MKKLLVCLMLCLIMISFVSCNSTQDNSDANQDVESDYTVYEESESEIETQVYETSASQISLEELLAAPESSADDFEILENSDGEWIITGYLGDDEILVIPETIDDIVVSEINQISFANFECIKAVKIPDTVKIVDYCAFANCPNLALLYTGAEYLYESSFANCTSLSEVYLSDSVLEIGYLAFAGDELLNDIYIPSSVTVIDSAAFYLIADNLIIYTDEGSYAHTFAQEQGINFEIQ